MLITLRQSPCSSGARQDAGNIHCAQWTKVNTEQASGAWSWAEALPLNRCMTLASHVSQSPSFLTCKMRVIITPVLPASQNGYESYDHFLKAEARSQCYFCCCLASMVIWRFIPCCRCLSIAQENKGMQSLPFTRRKRRLCHDLTFIQKQMMSLKRIKLLPWTFHPTPSKAALSLFPFFSSLLSFSFCFIQLVNRCFLNTCQVSGPVGS